MDIFRLHIVWSAAISAFPKQQALKPSPETITYFFCGIKTLRALQRSNEPLYWFSLALVPIACVLGTVLNAVTIIIRHKMRITVYADRKGAGWAKFSEKRHPHVPICTGE